MSDALALVPARPLMAAESPTRAEARPIVVVALGAIVAVAAMAAYGATLAPDISGLDSPELTAAAHRLGIAHAPGYPLYTMLGWLFSHAFPMSNVAFRLNLLSALLGAAACVAVYGVGLRLTTRPLVAAAGALTLAFSYQFWRDAIVAEVYTLDALLVAAIVLTALLWREAPTPARAAVVGVMVGLACATRTTSAFYVPAVAAFMWLSTRGDVKTSLPALAGGIAGGLALYAYLPLRSAAGVDVGPGEYALDGTLQVANLATWSGFWHHVSAAEFRSEAFAYGPVDAAGELGQFGGWLIGTFLFVGLPLGIAGMVRQWQSDRALLMLLAGMALPIAVFFSNYGALDKEFMFLPVYVVWSLWMIVGMDWTLSAADVAPGSALALAALALPLLLLAINAPRVSLRGDHAVRERGEAMLESTAANALIVGRFSDTAPLQYLQRVEGQRADVRVVNTWTAEPRLVRDLADANVGRSPFYLTQEDRALCAEFVCVPAGPLVEVRPRGR